MVVRELTCALRLVTFAATYAPSVLLDSVSCLNAAELAEKAVPKMLRVLSYTSSSFAIVWPLALPPYPNEAAVVSISSLRSYASCQNSSNWALLRSFGKRDLQSLYSCGNSPVQRIVNSPALTSAFSFYGCPAKIEYSWALLIWANKSSMGVYGSHFTFIPWRFNSRSIGLILPYLLR